jgi:Ca2+-binding RTX toxin-like protein
MPTTVLSADWVRADVGLWTMINNVWGRGDMVNGVDFTQSVTFDSATTPDGTVIAFDWGPGPADGRVLSYPELSTGWNPWVELGNRDNTARIGDIDQYLITYDTDISGELANFNTAIDIWLTSTPNGDATTITKEIIITLHEPDPTTFPEAPVYTDPGGYSGPVVVYEDIGNGIHTWDLIGVVGPFGGEAGTIDLAAMLQFLVAEGIISADDYIGGFEFGNEVYARPGGATGQMVINDLSYVFAGDRSIRGGAEDETLRGGTGNDWIIGEAGRDRLLGRAGDDRLGGSAGNDSLHGEAGRDVLRGGDGNDRLYGGDGNDNLGGQAGNDTLAGGAGSDTLVGGAGFDRFVFAGSGSDQVNDYQAGEDIDLRAYGDLTLASGPQAGSSRCWIVDDALGRWIMIDADGTGSAEARVLIRGAVVPQAADLILL